MSNQVFTRIILAKMQEVLQPQGYRKRGSTFYKECGEDVVLEVNLQKSRSSTQAQVKATVNLRVYSRTLTRAMGYPMDYPADPHRHWEARIGHFLPGMDDRWWVAQNEHESARAGQEIAQALIRYGLPVLEQVSSTDRLRQWWQSHRADLGTMPTIREAYLAALADPEKWRADQRRRLEDALARYEARHSGLRNRRPTEER
jgi:hypothetical protein